MKKIFAAVAAACLIACAFPADAVDSVSAEYGVGNHAVNLWRLGVQWQQDRHASWSWYWDLSVGGWHGDTGKVHDVGATPVVRYAKSARGPYLEGAIGFHILSDSHINSDLDFSTRFQFGSHLGAGYHHGRYDWQVRVQHLSNGGMRNPNPGINFVVLRLQYYVD